jgi:hypothetical protein
VRITAEPKFAIVPEWLLYADVGDSSVRLYAVLARHADKDGRSHPSRGRLAELMRCSTKTIDRAMRELEELGAVEVQRRFVNGSPTTNLFHLRTSDPATPVSLPLDMSLPSDTSDEGVGTPESNGTKALELEVGLPPTTASASVLPTLAPPARKKDSIYEVLFTLAAGLPYSKENRKRLTRTAADGLNVAAVEINATGISEADLRAAIYAWPSLFPNATCTPQAVKKHLPTLLSAAKGLVPRKQATELDDAVEGAQRYRDQREAERRMA